MWEPDAAALLASVWVDLMEAGLLDAQLPPGAQGVVAKVTLPPTDNLARKRVHHTAEAFRMGTLSQGSGPGRQVVVSVRPSSILPDRITSGCLLSDCLVGLLVVGSS